MLPQTPFYLLRHGESEANVKHLVAGAGVNSPLTAAGKAQADDLANYMDKLAVRPSRIFHSPQIRARETAERVNRVMGLHMTESHDLHEHNFGDWENTSWELVKDRVYANERPPNGENRSDFAVRVKRVLDEILAQEFETPPLIVAHGGTFHAIAKLYEWPMGPMRNCHLHFYSPLAHATFPWEIWQHDISGKDLLRTRSQYCPLFKDIKEAS